MVRVPVDTPLSPGENTQKSSLSLARLKQGKRKTRGVPKQINAMEAPDNEVGKLKRRYATELLEKRARVLGSRGTQGILDSVWNYPGYRPAKPHCFLWDERLVSRDF